MSCRLQHAGFVVITSWDLRFDRLHFGGARPVWFHPNSEGPPLTALVIITPAEGLGAHADGLVGDAAGGLDVHVLAGDARHAAALAAATACL